MTRWQWGALAVVGVGAITGMVYRAGVGAERQRGLTARLELVIAQADSDRVHAARVAHLELLGVERETARREAQTRAEAAERRALSAAGDAVAARGALQEARTSTDSLLAYPPMVDALTRQVGELDSARVGYRDALTASLQRGILLTARIATDSVLIAQQRNLLKTITPPPPSRFGWGCVAGVTVAAGLRTGAGLGITCGRRLG
jgi:hypothetical protein